MAQTLLLRDLFVGAILFSAINAEILSCQTELCVIRVEYSVKTTSDHSWNGWDRKLDMLFLDVNLNRRGMCTLTNTCNFHTFSCSHTLMMITQSEMSFHQRAELHIITSYNMRNQVNWKVWPQAIDVVENKFESVNWSVPLKWPWDNLTIVTWTILGESLFPLAILSATGYESEPWVHWSFASLNMTEFEDHLGCETRRR